MCIVLYVYRNAKSKWLLSCWHFPWGGRVVGVNVGCMQLQAGEHTYRLWSALKSVVKVVDAQADASVAEYGRSDSGDVWHL